MFGVGDNFVSVRVNFQSNTAEITMDFVGGGGIDVFGFPSRYYSTSTEGYTDGVSVL